MLLFTLCSFLTLYVDLVGGMGIGEANPSQIWISYLGFAYLFGSYN